MLELHLVELEIRLRIVVPESDTAEARAALSIPGRAQTGQDGYRLFTTKNLVHIAASLMKGNERWLALVRECVRAQTPLEACWRIGNRLEWVYRLNPDGTISENTHVIYGGLLRSVSDACHETRG